MDLLQRGRCNTDKKFEKRMKRNIFLDYAAWNLGEHLRPVEEKVSDLALSFFRNAALVTSITQVLSLPNYSFRQVRDGYSQIFPLETTALHLSARFGLAFLSRIILTVDLKEFPNGVNAQDSNGWTPLIYAADNGCESVVKLLLETGKVDIESKDSMYSRTPLIWAASSGHEEVIRLLLDTGKVDVNQRDIQTYTSLHLAVRSGHSGAVRLLYQMGKADINLEDSSGWTALTWAAQKGDEAVVKTLLGISEVHVNSNDLSKLTPLAHAARNGHEKVVRLLLAVDKVDVDAKDKDDWTPLIWAARSGHGAIVQLLLDSGKVDINWKDKSGLTPLYRAAVNGHEDVVELLLKTGKVVVPDEDDEDNEHRDTLFWAEEKGYYGVTQLIQISSIASFSRPIE
jgi:ankyrin repeat protein